jgi:hypothetical protein
MYLYWWFLILFSGLWFQCNSVNRVVHDDEIFDCVKNILQDYPGTQIQLDCWRGEDCFWRNVAVCVWPSLKNKKPRLCRKALWLRNRYYNPVFRRQFETLFEGSRFQEFFQVSHNLDALTIFFVNPNQPFEYIFGSVRGAVDHAINLPILI